MKKIFELFAFLLFLTSCEFSLFKSSEKINTTEHAENQSIEKATFKNIYIVDKNICEKKSLPITHFLIEYPDSLNVSFPDDKRNHIKIKKIKNGFVSEEISIGNSTVTYNTKTSAVSLLKGVTDELIQLLPSTKIDFIGEKIFNGEITLMAQGTIDFTAYRDQGYNGEYKMVMLLPLPQKKVDMNAVFVTLIANEDSEIYSYTDFETSGMIGKVWDTFRYIE